jgi:putative hemolysin
MIAFEVLVIVFLILLNGFFAMTELAVVSSRKSRLETLAKQGRPGARAALKLSGQPGRFLSMVQIGITLIGVFAGAYSGATLAERLTIYLQTLGLSFGWAEGFAFAVVVGAITYLSLIVGELVPKQIALRNPEAMATTVAPFMGALTRIASPAVFLLDASSRLVLRLLGHKQQEVTTITEEEIQMLVAEAESAGVVEPSEKRMISGVMRLGDKPVRAMMTPRTDVDWVDLDADAEQILAIVRESRHSRLPVGRGKIDEIAGIVRAKDVLEAFIDRGPVDVENLVQPVPVIHESLDSLAVIELLKREKVHLALVVDEYGAFEGLVTTSDILEAIAGAFGEDALAGEPDAVQRGDGSWLLDGMKQADEMADLLGIVLPDDRQFHTVAGFVLARLRHLPALGESFEWRGWRFEVVDLDGRRIDKVLASKLPENGD